MRHERKSIRSRLGRRGTVGVMVAVSSLALFPMLGLAVDGARVMFVRERMISALDAAALAGGRVINSTNVVNGQPQYLNDAIAYYNMNFPSGYFGAIPVAPPTATPSTDGTELTVSQTVNLPLMFGGFVGHPAPLQLSFSSTSYSGKVEVALVIDISNSMGNVEGSGTLSKIALAQQASTNMVNSLTSLGNNNVRIALVPVAGTVNVGQQYASATWTDGTAGYIYKSNYQNAIVSPPQPFQDTFTDSSGNNHQTDRWALFNSLQIPGVMPGGSPWAGCFEMRPAIYDTNTGMVTRWDVNDYQVSNDPASKFVPMFSPSQPDVTYTISPRTGKRKFNPYQNVYLQDIAADDNLLITPGNSYATNLSYVQIQQGDYAKYVSSNITVTDWMHDGPNADCLYFLQNADGTTTQQTAAPLARLSTDTNALDNAIAAMRVSQNTNDIGTNLAVGAFWGWETISPNSVFPDSQANYANIDYKKFMIVVTDGCDQNTERDYYAYDQFFVPNIGTSGNCNTSSDYTTVSALTSFQQGSMTSPANIFNYDVTAYTPYGYPWQNRLPYPVNADINHLSTQGMVTAMDGSFNTICTNMKAEGIQIYTIGIGQQGSNNQILKSCATDNRHYFPLSNPANLLATFQEIASQLTTVRLVARVGN